VFIAVANHDQVVDMHKLDAAHHSSGYVRLDLKLPRSMRASPRDSRGEPRCCQDRGTCRSRGDLFPAARLTFSGLALRIDAGTQSPGV
jgi:hypothetical protein